MDWNDLKYFLAVARTRNLTEASIHLRVSQATVARRITALEDSLKTELFIRKSDGYLLTETGMALVGSAEQAESQMVWIERGASSPPDSLVGNVRLEMPEILGQHLIIPSLPTFLDQYPGIVLELIADVRSVRLSKGQADVLVRLSRPDHGDYLIRKVGSIALGPYCSQGYMQRHMVPDAGTRPHNLIGWESALSYLPMARWMEEHLGDEHFVIRSHTMGSQLAAVEAGIGVAILPTFIASKLGLVRILEDHPPLVTDIWLLQHKDSQKLARVRALAKYVGDTLFASVPQLLGSNPE